MNPNVAEGIIRFAYAGCHGELGDIDMFCVDLPNGRMRCKAVYPEGYKDTFPGSWEQPPEFITLMTKDYLDFTPSTANYDWVDDVVQWLYTLNPDDLTIF